MTTAQKLQEELMKPLDILVDAGDYKNHYYSPDGYAKGHIRNKWMKTSIALIQKIRNDGAYSVDDIKKAIIFGYVCLDAEKYRLSILMAIDELEIQTLIYRYLKEGK